MANDKDRLKKARKFVLQERNRQTGDEEIAIVWRSPGKWVVQVDDFNEVLTKTGKRVWEPLPSNRDEGFINKTRFSLNEAWTVAEKFIKLQKFTKSKKQR